MSGIWPLEIKTETETLTPVVSTFVDRSLAGQRSARSGERHYWSMRLVTPLMERAKWQKFFAFGCKQRGRYDVFTVPSTILGQPLGTAEGTPAVSGDTVAGVRSLTTSGWTNNKTQLHAGDLFKFANHRKVYIAVQDTVSDGSGNALITFEPALVAGVTDGELLTVRDVPFTMAFSQDPLPLETTVEHWAKFDIQLEEVWNG